MNILHEPVLLEEVLMNLFPQGRDNIKNQGRYIDCTLGAGGYTKAILEAGGEVLGVDTDTVMIKIAEENILRLRSGRSFKLVQGNFRNLKKIAIENGFTDVDGIVMDLGVSNVHFTDQKRGFSFRNPEADLDMRLDSKSQALRASDLLNALRQDQLTQMFGRSLAKRIVDFRGGKKFEKVGDFLSLFPEKKSMDRIHPATKAFLALRIAVNSELDNLRESLPQAYELLKPASAGKPGGKLVVVSFHSLEDEITKDFMKSKGLSNDFVKPSDEEVARNPKSRSAIMRVLEK